jgi:hypothetical protein
MASVPGRLIRRAYIRETVRQIDRDFALWNGYINIIEYIKSGNQTDHTFMLPSITGLNISIHVLGSKITTLVYIVLTATHRRTKKQSVIILKQENVYEPLVGETDS